MRDTNAPFTGLNATIEVTPSFPNAHVEVTDDDGELVKDPNTGLFTASWKSWKDGEETVWINKYSSKLNIDTGLQ
jgi:hypothetical protein